MVRHSIHRVVSRFAMPGVASGLRVAVALAVLGALGACQNAPGSNSLPGSSAKPGSQANPALNQPMPQGFTCCNLHNENDWISDSNYSVLPLIPAGSPARVEGYGRYRVYTEINGQKMRLGLDYGRQEPLEQFAAKLIVAQDPRLKLATYPANVRQAITSARLMPGMTKEQVIMSRGYPQTDENPSLDAPMWRYWIDSFSEFQVNWNAQGRVSEVAGAPTVLSRVMFKP